LQFSSLEWGQKCAERIVFNGLNYTWPRIFIPIKTSDSSKWIAGGLRCPVHQSLWYSFQSDTANRALQFSSLEWGQKCAERIVFNGLNYTWPRIFIPIKTSDSSKWIAGGLRCPVLPKILLKISSQSTEGSSRWQKVYRLPLPL
jgi:uncharacterized Zn-finger protein